MGQLLGNPLFRATTSGGAIINGGYLRFFLTGTTTPTPVYANATLSTPLTQPVRTNSAGLPSVSGVATDIYLDPSILTKLVISDATDTPLKTIDPVNAIPTATDLTLAAVGSGGVPVTIADFVNWMEVHPEQFGAVGDGATDDTTALNNAIAFLKTLTRGGTLALSRSKTYNATCVNASLFGVAFDKALRITGHGSNMSRIIGTQTGVPVIDCIGSNNILLENFFVGSDGSHTPTCGILMARATTTSENCNGGRMFNVSVDGSFSIAALVSIAAESQVLTLSRFANSNATAKWKAFYTSNFNDIGVTSPHGTVLASSNTANRAIGCSFYAAFVGSGAEVMHYHGVAGWVFTACEMITGGNTGGKINRYTTHPGEGIFNGPVVFNECLMEGNDPVLHYLEAEAATPCFFKDIKHIGGYANQYASTVQEIVKTNSGGGATASLFHGEITRPRFNPGTTPRVVVDGLNANPIDIYNPEAVTTITVASFQANMPAMRADTINEAPSSTNYRGISFGTGIPVSGTFTRGHTRYPQAVAPTSDVDVTNVDVQYYGLLYWLCVDSGTPGDWVTVRRATSGNTGLRTALTGAPLGLEFFDTTLGKPCWADGAGAWKDAAGSAI